MRDIMFLFVNVIRHVWSQIGGGLFLILDQRNNNFHSQQTRVREVQLKILVPFITSQSVTVIMMEDILKEWLEMVLLLIFFMTIIFVIWKIINSSRVLHGSNGSNNTDTRRNDYNKRYVLFFHSKQALSLQSFTWSMSQYSDKISQSYDNIECVNQEQLE